jgi:hypothetical protein
MADPLLEYSKLSDDRSPVSAIDNTVRSEILCALRLQYVDLVVSIEVAVEVIVLHQTFISGEQQNLPCIVIAHARLMG